MTPKSEPGKTNRFSGVVKSVKATQQPEEPRITADQVREAFASFNFPLNDRGHNDIAYWTTRGKSEYSKLIDELHKKRADIIKKEDDTKAEEEAKLKALQALKDKQNEAKYTMPRLSDQDIAALFDEYGPPAPDPEWARTHMPNDPKKIRSLLEMQRKMADDMLKKHSKNTVNAVPEVPKASAMSQGMPMQQSPAPMMGQGGPSPLGMQGDMAGGGEPNTPFFVGDHAVVRITNPTNPNAATIWLVDVKKKVLRPFMSEKAFENAFEDPQEAQKSVITISTKELGPGGALEGFTPLKGDQGVNDDGSMDDIPFTEGQLQNRYGKPQDDVAENKALTMLDGVFGKLQGGEQPQQAPDMMGQEPDMTAQEPQMPQ